MKGSTAFRLAVFDVAGTTVLDGDAVVACLVSVLQKRIPISTRDVMAVMGIPKPVAIRELLSASGVERGIRCSSLSFVRWPWSFVRPWSFVLRPSPSR